MWKKALTMQKKGWIMQKFQQLIKLKLIAPAFPVCRMYHNIKHNEMENTSVIN